MYQYKPSPQNYLAYYRNLSPQDILTHHGILGQKWGKRNGPPYPLGISNHSASENKAGWRKSLDKSTSGGYHKLNKKELKRTSSGKSEKDAKKDKRKRAFKIGVAVAVTALAVYGGYKLKQSGKLDPLIEKGKTELDRLLGNDSITQTKISGLGDIPKNAAKATVQQATKIDPATGFKLGAKESVREAVSKVNPSGSMTNCRACSIANILRMRGFDVEALGDVQGGTLEKAVSDCFKGAKVTEIFSPTKEKITNNILKRFGEGSSGIMSAAFGPYQFEHAISWSVRNGVVFFFDGQNGSTDCSKLLDLISSSKSVEISRLDDLEINLDGIKKYIKNR